MIQDFFTSVFYFIVNCTSVFYGKPHLYLCTHFGLIVLLFMYLHYFLIPFFHNKLLLEHKQLKYLFKNYNNPHQRK